MKGSSQRYVGDPDAHKVDQFLKKLETTKQSPPTSMNEHSRQHADSSDNSTFDSRNESAFFETDSRNESAFFETACEPIDRQLFETRQCFVDRSEGSPPAQDSVDSFIERAQSGQSSIGRSQEEVLQLVDRNSDTRFFEEGLPDAILKLDRRHAIPTPRHKNDVLLEIEACTVDRRDLMVRPGVRCTESLPQGVETTGMDCIGRVVQLTTHARAVYGISIDDRVAALYPFEYNDGYKDKGRRNNRYALVDAGFVVVVPKHVDAAEASCMIRLYLSAFQSISKGLSLHSRYDYNQLKGQSILIQNGQTELGRALIDLAALLGASQIFATGPTETHPMLMEMGATPLGAETFGWELFLEEKLSLVMVQDMPTADNFEQFISILHEYKGNLVYIHHGHKEDGDDLGITSDDVSCDGLQFQELARKAKEAFHAAKFSLRLSCSPKYIVYEGVWPSCKENPNQFKEDLRYLFTLLGRGSLKPNVNECINLEEIGEVQDRIELLGKNGTIVCLPKSATPLYEKKAHLVAPPTTPTSPSLSFLMPRRDPQGFPVFDNDITDFSPYNDESVNTYASDAGYVRAASDFLSDFHCMQDTKGHTRGVSDNISLPALPETSSYSNSNFNHLANGGMQYAEGQNEYYHNDASSMIGSVGQNSASNTSMAQTALSDGVLKTTRPFGEEDPPLSIQFRDKKSRRYIAYQRQKRAKETWKKSQQNKNANEKEVQEEDGGSYTDQGTAVPPFPTYSARKLRREARKREPTAGAAPANDVDRKSVATNTGAINAMVPKSGRTTSREHTHGEAPVNDVDRKPVAKNAGAIKVMHSEYAVPKRGQMTASTVSGVDTSQVTTSIDEIKFKRRSRAVRLALSGSHSQDAQLESEDARNEDECARDICSNNSSSFHTLMSKWKQVDDLSRQS